MAVVTLCAECLYTEHENNPLIIHLLRSLFDETNSAQVLKSASSIFDGIILLWYSFYMMLNKDM